MPLNTAEIKRRREGAGMTQAAAAERVGFANQSAWHRIESGALKNPTLETLERIASVLGCSPCDLIAPPAPKTKRTRR